MRIVHTESSLGWGDQEIRVFSESQGRNRCDLVSTHSSTDAWLTALALLALGRPLPMVRTRHISAPVPRNPPTRWLYTRATARIVTTGEAMLGGMERIYVQVRR